MPRGGPNRGQGRKPGSVNVLTGKTREIVERAAGAGVLPLEVLLDNMRFYHQAAAEALATMFRGEMPGSLTWDAINGTWEQAEGDEPESLPRQIIEGIQNVLGLRKMAGEEAARAAPYCHPRQGYAGEEGGLVDEEMPLAERLKEYQRRDDLKAAGDNVVDLKRPGDQ
jgi:hypothetical protein